MRHRLKVKYKTYIEVQPPAEREADVHERIHVVKLCLFKGLMTDAETLEERSSDATRTARARFGMDMDILRKGDVYGEGRRREKLPMGDGYFIY